MAMVYGCTARRVGSRSVEESAEDFAHRIVQGLDIRFDQHDIDLDLFARGILFCHPYTKGVAVKKLLGKLEKSIDIIVMIDDRSYNLESVMQAVKEWNEQNNQAIKFVGFHYTAVEHMDHTFNEKIVAQQLAHLIAHKEYLLEEEIKGIYFQHR